MGAAQRHLLTIPSMAASVAVGWADGLKRAGIVEEYRLGPATLEDVYVELVGRADALQNGNGNGNGRSGATTPVAEGAKEVSRVGAA